MSEVLMLSVTMDTTARASKYQLHLFSGHVMDCDELPTAEAMDYRTVKFITETTSVSSGAIGRIDKIAKY